MFNAASATPLMRFVLVFAIGTIALKAQPLSFILPQNFLIGPGCCSVLTGDFNRDGKTDIVVAHSASNVIVFLASGDGRFTRKETAQSQRPGSIIGPLIAVADINSDGIQDIFASSDAGPVVLLGNGDGSFSAPVALDLGGGGLIAIADFNGDGIPDVLGSSSDGRFFAVHLGKGDGTFQAAGPNVSPPEGDCCLVVVGDFNGDGKLDFAGTSVRNSSKVYVWLGNGDGSFQNVLTSPSPLAETFKPLAVGDFNRDGKLDLAIATQHNAGLLFGNGDGTFRPGPVYTAALSVDQPIRAHLIVADFNGDGFPDLADGFMVLLGNGDGTLQSPATFGQWVNPPVGPGKYLAAADFNGNGKMGLIGAAEDGTVLSVLINNTPGTDASVAAVSAADYGGVLNPGSIATAFGKGLTDATASAMTLPLPTVLQNTKVRILDQSGVERLAPLLYVSPSQVNFRVPPEIAFGYAIINVDNGKTPLVQGARSTLVKDIAPGFFTADGSGHGPPAATAIAIQSNGQRTPIPVFRCSSTGCVLVPLDLTTNGTVYLSVYGTGFASIAPARASCREAIKEALLTVTYIGPQGQYPGLDQLNLQLPKDLPSGVVEIDCIFSGALIAESVARSFTILIQ